MERTRLATLNLVKEMTPEQLRWAPVPGVNCIGFLLFHSFRGEDMYFHSTITKPGEVWVREGWFERWKMPATVAGERLQATTGNSWTPDEVGGWEPPDLNDLLEYGTAVRASSLATLKDLDLGRFTETPRPNRPEVTIEGFLFLASHHESQHLGQMDYLAGLMRQG
jgi:hypothetical protein